MKPKKSNVISLPKQIVRPPSERGYREDGWSNLVTGLGTTMDKRMSSQLNWEDHPPEFYEQLYAGGGIPSRIVDLIPDESLRAWIDWIKVEPGKKEKLEDRCEELAVRENVLKSWKWGRAYGGACLHIVTNTSDPSSPLKKGEKVLALRDLSRWDLRILTTDIESDFGSVNYGHPRIYYLNVQMGSTYKGYPIHWTRMIRFDGQLVPRRTFIRNNYWHDSILNRLYNAIRNYESSHDTVAVCLQDFNVDVYKLKGLANYVATGREDIVKSRIEILQLSKSVLNAMMLDTDMESYENVGRNLEGVAELLVLAMNRLVAETDIPHTKLLGESPDGSNATGNSTSQQWYNFISSEQRNYLKPKMQRLFEVIFGEDLNWKFRSLRELDEIEKAEVRNKQSQTDKNYIDSQVLDPSEVAQSRFGGEEYSLDTELDLEGRESGEIDPQGGDQEGDDMPPGDRNTPPGAGGKDPESDPPNPGKTGKAAKDVKAPEEKKDGVEGKSDISNPSRASTSGNPATLNAGADESEFGLRNQIHETPNGEPKTKPFISQTMSLPNTDPATDPAMPPPGQPNKPRVVEPTIGNGIVAPSGGNTDADDAGKPQRAAVVIVRKGDSFLMGKRKDTGRWTLPGGGVNLNESHHQGGIRELKEETGLEAKRLKFLGARIVESKQGKKVHVNLYEHKHDSDQNPSGKNDPDKEIGSFRWVPANQPLPKDIMENLQHPNNVALQHMGLLK